MYCSEDMYVLPNYCSLLPCTAAQYSTLMCCKAVLYYTLKVPQHQRRTWNCWTMRQSSFGWRNETARRSRNPVSFLLAWSWFLVVSACP